MTMHKTVVGFALLICVLVAMYLFSMKPASPASGVVPDVFGEKSIVVSTADQEGVIYHSATGKMIQLTLPLPGSVTGSDFVTRGVAVDSWFQDGGFAVGLLDSSGNVLYEALARSTGKPAAGYQSFAAEIFVQPSFAGDAVLILAEGQDGDLETGIYAMVPIRIEP